MHIKYSKTIKHNERQNKQNKLNSFNQNIKKREI